MHCCSPFGCQPVGAELFAATSSEKFGTIIADVRCRSAPVAEVGPDLAVVGSRTMQCVWTAEELHIIQNKYKILSSGVMGNELDVVLQ